MKLLVRVLLLLLCASGPLRAQTLTDGLMMPKGDLCTGFLYGYDRWSDYWEGQLKRDNGNIGTITTQSVSWMGSYGITDRLNVIGMVPYVWTRASQGTLTGMSGIQDVTLGVKYTVLTRSAGKAGALKAFAVAAYGGPLTDYTPDFQPLSIGSASHRVSGRLTLNYTNKSGLYLNGSAGYTWRGDVTLDRPSYFTDGRLYLNDEVSMPGVFDYTISAGYMKDRLQVPISFSQQNTHGGGDIRRQDMPFVSNRMNFSKLDGMVMYYLPRPKNLAVRVAATYTVSGRNVGQATTVMAGLLYTFHF